MARHRVVALALPGVVTFDLGCAIQVFAHAPTESGEPGHYEFTTCSERRQVPTQDGFRLLVDHGVDAVARADTVVVPGYDTLATSFPAVEVVDDVLYVDEGMVLTSAGLAGGLDLALHVVRRDHGAWAAAELARWNVVAPHRDGGQAQYLPVPVPASSGSGLGSTRAWAVDHLDRRPTVTDLARHARVSERTLTRRFRGETGLSPAAWLQRARLQRARELLEATALPIETVASRAGYPSAAAFRDGFRRALHTSPSAYRRAFRLSE